jgi:hypothetical protein
LPIFQQRTSSHRGRSDRAIRYPCATRVSYAIGTQNAGLAALFTTTAAQEESLASSPRASKLAHACWAYDGRATLRRPR